MIRRLTEQERFNNILEVLGDLDRYTLSREARELVLMAQMYASGNCTLYEGDEEE